MDLITPMFLMVLIMLLLNNCYMLGVSFGFIEASNLDTPQSKTDTRRRIITGGMGVNASLIMMLFSAPPYTFEQKKR